VNQNRKITLIKNTMKSGNYLILNKNYTKKCTGLISYGECTMSLWWFLVVWVLEECTQ